jgi:hypothetical protein
MTTNELDAVVVTALGIKEKKSLYSYQEVKGDAVTKVKVLNL